MQEEPHIGHLIKAELRKQGRTISWLASQLGYSRQNVYKLFERRWIYTDLLLKISDIMGHDFFKCYSEYWSCGGCKPLVYISDKENDEKASINRRRC